MTSALFAESRLSRGKIYVIVISFLIGFLLVTQLREQRSAIHSLREASEKDLGQIVRDLNTETSALRLEKARLELQLLKIERTAADNKTVLQEASKRLANLKILAGIGEVKGPGIRIIVTDEKKVLTGFDLYDLINEIRAAGSEAISVNGYRLTAESSFSLVNGEITLDGKKIAPPYEIKVIGTPETLYQGLVLPGGIRDSLTSLEGVSFYITKEKDLLVAAAQKLPEQSLGAVRQ
jgi:uncharacterized protein YlxW (UPF0749 family)